MQALKLCRGLPEPWDPPRSGRKQVSEPLPSPGLKASEWVSGGDRAVNPSPRLPSGSYFR